MIGRINSAASRVVPAGPSPTSLPREGNHGHSGYRGLRRQTGTLTPLALLKPVEVGGVTISRATLHNADEVARKDVRVGDTVKVERAGDVIPAIAERVPVPGEERQAPFVMPTIVPSAVRRWRAKAPTFTARPDRLYGATKGAIEHFASKSALNIDGLGKDGGPVGRCRNGQTCLYSRTKEQLLTLEGFADRSASLLHGIHRAKQNPSLERLQWDWIRQVGQHIAKVLAKQFGTLPD